MISAELNRNHNINVDDVLVARWGSNDYKYYIVIRLVGKKSLEIQEIKKQTEEISWGERHCVPLKKSLVGAPMVRRIDWAGYVKINDLGVFASKKESIKVSGVDIFNPDYYTDHG